MSFGFASHCIHGRSILPYWLAEQSQYMQEHPTWCAGTGPQLQAICALDLKERIQEVNQE